MFGFIERHHKSGERCQAMHNRTIMFGCYFKNYRGEESRRFGFCQNAL